MKIQQLILFGLFLLSANSLACREVRWSSSEWAENAQAAYVGRVTYASVFNEAAIVETDPVQAAVTASMADLVLGISVVETLKGDPKDSLDISLSWCGGGSAEVAEQVIAFRLGDQWHVQTSGTGIAEAKAALLSRSTATPKSSAR